MAGTTGAVLALTVVGLDGAPKTDVVEGAFAAGAAALFLSAACLRMVRWRRSGDRSRGMLGAALLVLGLLALPGADLTGHAGGVSLESPARTLAHVLGTALCLALVRMALRDSERATGAHPGASGARLLGPVAVLTLLGVGSVAGLVVLEPGVVHGTVLWDVVVHTTLACAWIGTGLMAALRDATQPWAGRVAPLLGCLGVVELLRTLDHVRPGGWALPAVALLASIAMVAAQVAWIDTQTPVVHPGTDRLHVPDPTIGYVDVSAPLGPRDDFEVTATVAAAVEKWRCLGREIRIRGGAGVAHARAESLAAALDTLLDNADRHAPGTPVTVYVVAIADRIEISVSDRGPGLSAALAERLFAPWEHAHGLASARTGLRRDGGDLTLRTRIGGATFVVSLPAGGRPPGRHVQPRGSALPRAIHAHLA